MVMMKGLFLVFVRTSLVLVLLLLHDVRCYPEGAGGCKGGGPAVGFMHLLGDPITGGLEEGGLMISLDGELLHPQKPANFTINVDHTLKIFRSSDSFRGVLLRLEHPNVEADTASALIPTGGNLRSADYACMFEPGNVVGVTHNSKWDKESSEAILHVKEVAADIKLDVTAVITVFQSEFYYSGFTLNAVDSTAETTFSPTAASTFHPTVVPTTAVPSSHPTVSPTKNPTSAPITIQPTLTPTVAPPTTNPTTSAPTSKPTTRPTTSAPTNKPTTRPATSAPTNKPTTSPTTSAPTNKPTTRPTTSAPATRPTVMPFLAMHPTPFPTLPPLPDATAILPTSAPVSRPTTNPATSAPTNKPTTRPTTSAPTTRPTVMPFLTTHPTPFPTMPSTPDATAILPTSAPVSRPTNVPKQEATPDPSPSPTRNPWADPTARPTIRPTTNKPISASPTIAPVMTNESPTLMHQPSPIPTHDPALSPISLKPSSSLTLDESNLFVTGFMLVDASTNQDIGLLKDGDLINLSTVGDELNIRAVTKGEVSSVIFDFDGKEKFNKEKRAPFTLGGNPRGNYKVVPQLAVSGFHSLTATPHSERLGRGTSHGSLTVTFMVIDESFEE